MATVSSFLKGCRPCDKTAIRSLLLARGFKPRILILASPNMFGKTEKQSWVVASKEDYSLLVDCIFAVMNEVESRGDGHPYDPGVVAMRNSMNRCYSRLGWSEA